MDNKRYTLEELKEVDRELYESAARIKHENRERAAKERALADEFWTRIEALEQKRK